MDRRQFIKKTTLAVLGSSVLVGGYTWQVEPLWVEWTKVNMSIRNLPKRLEGKTLIQLSDIHIGPRVDKSYVIRTLQEASAIEPDFVVYTGDFISLVDGKAPYEDLQDILTHLAIGKEGTAAILGNHDYGAAWKEPDMADEIARMLSYSGVTVLRNSTTDFAGLQLIGIDDYWGTNFFPEKAMNLYDPGKPTIVLCHNPDVCDLDVWNGYAGWILSGHTHGGQCRPPFLPAPILPVKNKAYSQGLIPLADGRSLYINRGLGHSIKVRFNVRPEVTLFTLKSI
ncbi:phosphoesterase [Sphingobacterium alkalisoli]|uniref:Phosphoesterase n=1 Tax=Sphingobacterium alkalisoli TaxID=1874115 RepID=A0A4U0GUT2_9SPHI|nr:metallophosphoesterase [Sphingobacterium alkalisoli]TJY62748.1 phosphoesterase [Sphingobacterium alkalisoli]GGH28646.1 metallophosphoesterase [Sphingobacterium alkalisoli]